MEAVACAARPIDWRFLLPNLTGEPLDHLLLCGGSPELPASLQQLAVARRVSTPSDVSGFADGVVVLEDATISVDAALSYLGGNGVVYWEVNRRTTRHLGLTASRAMGRLRRLGVTPTAAYWIKPGYPNRQMYLPMPSGGAFRWYLDTLYRSTTPARRLLKAGMRTLSITDRGLPAFAPSYAITARRGAPGPPALVDLACRLLRWNHSEVQSVFLAHGAAEWNRVAILLFEANASTPSAAVKFVRHAAFNQHVKWEHQCLGEIAAMLDDSLRSSLPSSKLCRWNELAVAVETCVPGANLSSRTGATEAQLLDDLRLAVRWLEDFDCATTIEHVPAGDWLRRHLLDGLCQEYESTFGLTAAERHLFETVNTHLAGLEHARLPIVWQHGDFGPWNVYRDRGRLSVIDWERARRGPALADALYFATHWSAAVAGRTTADERQQHFESMFCGGAHGPVASALRAALAAYMQRMEMAPALLPFLLVYIVLEQALDRVRRWGMLGAAESGDRHRNPDVGCLSVLGHHADRLFGAETCRAA
jgi:hypothetical protein